MEYKKNFEGERIYLKTLDAQQLSKNYQRWMKDREVLKYLANPDGDYSAVNLSAYVRTMNDSRQDYLLGIFLKDDSSHIGNIKIGGIEPRHKFADVGLVLGERSLWGKGYATESVRLAARFAFDVLGLNKLYAGIIDGNEASMKVFTKAGFSSAGRFHRHWLVEGEYRDSELVELINDHT